jgi:hypothetical protein
LNEHDEIFPPLFVNHFPTRYSLSFDNVGVGYGQLYVAGLFLTFSFGLFLPGWSCRQIFWSLTGKKILIVRETNYSGVLSLFLVGEKERERDENFDLLCRKWWGGKGRPNHWFIWSGGLGDHHESGYLSPSWAGLFLRGSFQGKEIGSQGAREGTIIRKGWTKS